MKILIVDDEPIAIGILEKYIRQIEGLELAGSCRNGIEAYNTLQRLPVDLLLLDIEMPGMTGLSLLQSLQQRPKVILTTAYREYALEGYEFDVVDYLLKPVSFERFLKAIQKAAPKPALGDAVPPLARRFLYFKSAQKMVQVYLDEICYVESLSNYVRIFLQHGGSVVTYQKLGELARELPAEAFVRIHRSYLVRIDKIKAYTPQLVDVGQKELPVGGQYRETFLQALK
ncbi:MAG: response regulator transcription factor [Saprospiraceae bacterium]|nr:response regulator transcription factor [Saprospiraceae bacterium]